MSKTKIEIDAIKDLYKAAEKAHTLIHNSLLGDKKYNYEGIREIRDALGAALTNIDYGNKEWPE